jgi:SAM-dependent methyltransferase
MLHNHLLSIIACPKCAGLLRPEQDSLICAKCGSIFRVERNVPILLQFDRTMKVADPSAGDFDFDYLTHYQRDAENFNYFEERVGATAHDERRLREYILNEFPTKAESVLDVGSGSAWLAAHYQGSDTFLCSLDATIINTARALELYPSKNHVAVVADAFRLPFRAGSFDVVLASEIIEHVPDPERFVGELLRVLQPGGSLIVTTPYKEILRFGICVHCNQPTPFNAHIHSFDEDKLSGYALAQNGVRSEWKVFGNKVLIFARTYTVLRYLPFALWKLVDRIANSIYNKPAHILVTYTKIR